MIRKRKQLIYFFLFLSIVGINDVMAWGGNIGWASTGDSGTSSSGDTDPDTTEALGTGSDSSGNPITYTCVYNYDISANNSITINGYDLNDKSLMDTTLNISKADSILAGTSIGLDIYETKNVSWTVKKAEAMESKTITTNTRYYKCSYTEKKISNNNCVTFHGGTELCLYSMSLFSRIQLIKASCSQNNYTTTSLVCVTKIGCTASHTYSYTDSVTTTEEAVKTTNADKQKECEELAESKAKKAAQGYIYPSYKVTLPDSNDVDGSSSIEIPATGEVQEEGNKIYAKYSYNPKKVCMNVKNARVRYITSSDSCSTEESTKEIEVQNGSNHWHYFIPLNLTSNDIAEVNLSPSGQGLLVEGQCRYVMENNPISSATPYTDLIIKADKTNFSGDYYKGTAGKDYNEIKNGCYLTSKIKIPVTQKFYNEVTDNKGNITFKGFNFYYKPIDITDPFPNGTTSTSIWNDWDGTNPNISESYKTWTYIADVSNTNAIRAYTSEHPYTSWSNMYTTGRSSFIETEGIITRNTGVTNSFYKLGCGPSNANWSDCR